MTRKRVRKVAEIHGGQIQGRRQRQEDCFAIERYGPRAALAVVADGLGGHPAGDVASREGVREFIRCFARGRDGRKGDPHHWLEEAVHAAHRHLLKEQRAHAEMVGMATTLVGLYLDGGALWGASVGDSYLLRLRDGELARLNELHGEGGGVSSAIGFNLTEIDLIGELRAAAGDRYLLATDGIVTLDETAVTRGLGADSSEAAVGAMLAAVEHHAHPYQDNTTLVAVFL